MFRKAKKLSKRLGLNKDSCTAGSGFTMNNNKDVSKTYVSDENPSEKQQSQRKQQSLPSPQFTLNIDRVSTRGSAANSDLVDDDSTSSKSTESEELKLSPQARPILGKCQTAPNAQSLYDTSPNSLQRQLSMMDTGNLDLLLSMETQARLEDQAKREKEQQQQQLLEHDNMLAPRPTRIKFELPVTPPRSRSPARLTYPRARPVRSLPDEGLTANTMRHSFPSSNPKTRRAGWRHLFSDREEEEAKPAPIPITIGTRVRLKMRPLPTFGFVRYIGAVGFGRGEYIGIELDHGVGNSDGSVDGTRYFETDPHRGTFAKRHELDAVAE
ncbi:hypothetical protein BD408DRAFT_442408 [Parasitella parasitica]|nr:hypothetical protein BD408DRAFT_442408 [Parasitella parasitica]